MSTLTLFNSLQTKTPTSLVWPDPIPHWEKGSGTWP